MATTGSVLTEEQLLCPICLDLLNLPVSTPCGHNFCKDCIQGYWQSAKLSQCPICKQKYDKRPELRVNTLISEIASQVKKSLEKKGRYEAGPVDRCSSQRGDVSCDLCVGKRVKTLKSFCETLLEPWHVLDTFKKPHLMGPTMNTQDRVCKKHKKPLDLFCTTDQTYVCQTCVKKEHSTHHTVPIGDESRDKRAQIRKLNEEVAEMINGRLQTINEINQSVQLSRGSTEREIREGLQVFNRLLHFVQRGQAELVEEINAKQRQVESRARGLVMGLEEEIDELRQRRAGLEHLLHTGDDLYLLRSFPTVSTPPASKDRMEICTEGVVYVGMVRRAVQRVACELEEAVKAEVKQLCETEIQRAQQHAVDVTLDPDTAHPKLVLSDNKKQVYHGDVVQSLPDSPERFYPGVSVLGKEGFSSGRFYYEVQVKGKTEWDIGVGLESINRKGGNILNPESGYWALGMRKDKSYWALSSTPTCVPLAEEPQRLGVHVDLESGQVSFYNVDAASHIYSFTGCSFSERLFPYFNPRRNHSGLNSAPLIISPVNASI